MYLRVPEDYSYEGTVNLIAALFRLTAQDIRFGDEKAKEFLDTQWFEDLCDGINVKPKTVRFYILNKKVKSRVTYE
jgi:hypothetical protein